MGNSCVPSRKDKKESETEEGRRSAPPAARSVAHAAGAAPMGNSVVKQKVDRAEASKVLSLEDGGLRWKDFEKLSIARRIPTLRYLDLTRNKLAGPFSVEVAALTALKKLTLDGNRLENLAGLASLVNLEELSANSNLLANVDDVAKLGKLKLLSLNANKLKALPTLTRLTHLKTLSFSSNAVSAIPNEVFSLPALEDLDASNNQISGIDTALQVTAKNLHRVDLSQNNVSTLPKSLFTDTRLSTLEVGGNPLSPAELKTLPGYDEWLLRQKKIIDKQISGGLTAKLIEEH
ncbi:Plant intracellular Ras-group-related LRR protein 7 [Diplonema papillatum]|nr:Plant intracellular Ras-group-related LRR protein 7 [Diplonema papillatum]